MDKVRVIKRSLRCRLFGWLGLVPVMGVVPALLAVRLFWRVRAETGPEWNPAGRQLRFGYALALTGLVLTTLLVAGGLTVFVVQLQE